MATPSPTVAGEGLLNARLREAPAVHGLKGFEKVGIPAGLVHTREEAHGWDQTRHGASWDGTTQSLARSGSQARS